jgi:hypothetical protein
VPDLIEQLQRSAEDPDGGIDVIRYDGDSAADVLKRVFEWGHRAGFVPLLAPLKDDEPGHPALPASLRHRHVLAVCEDGPSHETAIRWIRELATISPRRHLVVAPNQIHSGSHFRLATGQSEMTPGVDLRRERRAARWHRRGRARIGDRWLVAAIESARRHDDEPRATSLT